MKCNNCGVYYEHCMLAEDKGHTCLKREKLYNIEFENATYNVDYQCDAFICYAEWKDGTSLTQEELDNIPSDVTYEYLIDYLY